MHSASQHTQTSKSKIFTYVIFRPLMFYREPAMSQGTPKSNQGIIWVQMQSKQSNTKAPTFFQIFKQHTTTIQFCLEQGLNRVVKNALRRCHLQESMASTRSGEQILAWCPIKEDCVCDQGPRARITGTEMRKVEAAGAICQAKKMLLIKYF